jgi:hypothetical protein
LFAVFWTSAALSSRSKTQKVVIEWGQKKRIALYIPQMTLLASAIIIRAVAKPQKKDMECGWDNRARK